MLEHFGYLNDILKQMNYKKPLTVKRIDQLGSRKSGKTIQDFDFECKATVLSNPKIKTYVFRNMSEQLYDTWKQLKNRWVLFAIGLEYKISETRKTINYRDSEIECRALYKQNNSEIKLTGLPDNSKYDYVIRHVDEAHQILEKDWQDMADAIRGCKQLLEINSCNPWSILNFYVKSVVTYCPQNEKQIINEHEQFYFNEKDKRIVHYQNWKLNYLLPKHEGQRLLELEALDPISSRVRSHGLVGYESGGIYTHLIHKISRLLQPSYRFSAGLDYGFKDDALACVLISLNAYGIVANVISGLTELIPNRFQNIRKIANMGTGGCLISSGVAMGINNNFNNYFAIPTIIAGGSEIINTLLLPLGNTHNNTELQEVFTDERARLINGSVNDYQSTDDGMVDVDLNDDSMSEINLDRASLNWDYSYAYTLGGV